MIKEQLLAEIEALPKHRLAEVIQYIRFLQYLERQNLNVEDKAMFDEMTYVTYENRNNPHVTIHCLGCNQLRKHGGVHKYSQGHYKNHSNFAQAEEFAVSTGLPVKFCSFCKPPGCR